ncbi:hypothetical protein [Variovorax sp. RCC_210]|uniref:hypothetical protein n=1 Tax=Variovorax sp. RCC_210 TaxID=3239217 RepID=UPI00352341D1
MKYPDIGELDRLVKIRLWSDSASSGFAIDQQFDPGQDAWARIDPAGSALFYGTQQIEPGMTHRLATWRSSTINALAITGRHVVEHEGIRYRVRRVTDINGRKDFVLMDLEQLKAIAP